MGFVGINRSKRLIKNPPTLDLVPAVKFKGKFKSPLFPDCLDELLLANFSTQIDRESVEGGPVPPGPGTDQVDKE